MTVEQKVIVVTGAGGGMGKAIIQEQLKQGNRVVGLDLSIDALSDIAQDALQCFEVNVLQEERVQAICQQVFDKYGRIDGLVNALGIAQSATPIEEVSMDEWNRLMDVNVKSLFITTKAVVPFMKNSKGVLLLQLPRFQRCDLDRAYKPILRRRVQQRALQEGLRLSLLPVKFVLIRFIQAQPTHRCLVNLPHRVLM